MKRLIAAIVLIVAAILLSVLGYNDMRKSGKMLIDSFKETVNAVESGDENAVNSKLRDSLDVWEKHKTRFEIYINHDELDDIQDATKELEQHLNGSREVEVKDLCLDCISKLEHIIDAETPSIGELL